MKKKHEKSIEEVAKVMQTDMGKAFLPPSRAPPNPSRASPEPVQTPLKVGPGGTVVPRGRRRRAPASERRRTAARGRLRRCPRVVERRFKAEVQADRLSRFGHKPVRDGRETQIRQVLK